MYTKIDKNSEKGGIFTGMIGGALSLTVSAVVVKIIGLIYKIPISSILGDEGMGYFNSAYTVYAFFYLLCTAGVPKAVMILLSEAKAKGRKPEEAEILRVSLRLFTLIGLLGTVLLLLFSGPISLLIANRGAFFTMISIAPSIVLVSVAGVIRGYLSANTRLLDIAISQVIEGVGKLAVGLVLAMVGRWLGVNLQMLSAITIFGVTFGSFFGLLYLLVISKIKITSQKTEQNAEDLNAKLIRKRIFTISIPITLSAAVMSLTSIIDLGIVMRSLLNSGVDEAGASALYGNYTTLAVPMFNLAISVISPISVAFLPVFTSRIAKGDQVGLIEAERSALELTAAISAPMMIGLAVYSEEILSMLFLNSEIEVGAILLRLISPAILLSSILLIVNTLLEAAGRVRAPLISMTVGSVVKIAVSYYLIGFTDMGVAGAPIGTVMSYAAALITSLLIYGSCFGRGAPIFACILIPHINALTAVAISVVCFMGLSASFSKNLSLLLSIALAALVYLAISIFTGTLGIEKMGKMAKYTNFSQ